MRNNQVKLTISMYGKVTRQARRTHPFAMKTITRTEMLPRTSMIQINIKTIFDLQTKPEQKYMIYDIETGIRRHCNVVKNGRITGFIQVLKDHPNITVGDLIFLSCQEDIHGNIIFIVMLVKADANITKAADSFHAKIDRKIRTYFDVGQYVQVRENIRN